MYCILLVYVCKEKIRLAKKRNEITPTHVGCGSKRLFYTHLPSKRKGIPSPAPAQKNPRKNIKSASILKSELSNAVSPVQMKW